MLGRMLVLSGVTLIAATQGSDSWARGGHGSGHAGHGGGGFHSVTVPRTVFFAAPVVYFRSAYYPSPYYPPAYYAPPQPVPYYQPPVQSALPPLASYAPPPPPPQSSYPPANVEPAQAPIYFCRDGSGRVGVTNRREDMAGKECREQLDQNTMQRSTRGPYAVQDALRYRFYCPDSRKYYPEVNICDSAWLKVVPERAAAAR